MTTYSSNSKTINKSGAEVFTVFSDLTKLEKIREKIAESGQIQNFSLSENEIMFDTNIAGKIILRIVERVPNSKIVFALESTLKNADLQINITEKSSATSEITLALTADLPLMLKMMLGDKLNEGIDRIAEAIARGANGDF